MNNSFLYPFTSKHGTLINREDDLNLEEIVNFFTNIPKEQEYILKILYGLEVNKDIIEFRFEVISEFISNQNLCNKLIEAFKTVSRLESEYSHIKIQFSRGKSDINYYISFFTSLYTDTCDLLISLLKVYEQIYHALSSIEIKSRGLKHLFAIVDKTDFGELIKLCEKLKSENFVGVKLLMDKFYKILDAEIVVEDEFNDKKTKSRLNGYNTILNFGKVKITKDLIKIYKELSVFNEYAEEMAFIKFAIKYYNFLKEKNIPITNPSFKNKMNITNLYNLSLLIKARNKKIDPQFVNLESDDAGIIITGDNDTGKTIYLQSIGIAQVFAQAGLFIPAEAAVFKIYDNLIAYFTSQENIDVGGKFENECLFVSKYIKNCEANTLLLLNEIFQSTNDIDGSEVLYNVLLYLTGKDVKWILVTHLNHIQNKFANLEFKNQYKINNLVASIDNQKYEITEKLD